MLKIAAFRRQTLQILLAHGFQIGPSVVPQFPNEAINDVPLAQNQHG